MDSIPCSHRKICLISNKQRKNCTGPRRAAYAGRGGDAMCVRPERVGLLLLGIGAGLLISFALCGWFLRAAIALALIVIGLVLLN